MIRIPIKEHFKKSLKQKIKDTIFLLKHSFVLLGKNKEIKKPIIYMIFLSIFIISLIFGAVLNFIEKHMGLGMIFLFLSFILIFFAFFYNTRQKANLCWLVYAILRGKTATYKEANRRTKKLKAQLRFIAFVNILMTYVGGCRSGKRGIGGFLMNLFLRGIIEIWDLVSHYILPATVIEQKHFKELLPKLKALRNNVPATLMGVFGIDFVGDVVGVLLVPIYLFLFVISVGIGYLVSPKTPGTVITVFGFSFSWVPVFIMLYIALIIGEAIKKLIASIKVIYFTIFYTSITRPNVIIPNIRRDITNYLLMEEIHSEKGS